MMLRFLTGCVLAVSLAGGAAQARQARAPAAPASAAAPASVPAQAPIVLPPSVPATVGVPPSMTAGPAAGSLLQTIAALCLVLGLLAVLAWFMKRYGPKAQGGSAHVKLVGALNLGGRERIMVVEVGDQWIVVGASPGRVNALATMPRQPGIETQATLHPHQPSASSFAEWLKQTIDKRNAK
jgi:flagellar protein FliO/FliZ